MGDFSHIFSILPYDLQLLVLKWVFIPMKCIDTRYSNVTYLTNYDLGIVILEWGCRANNFVTIYTRH